MVSRRGQSFCGIISATLLLVIMIPLAPTIAASSGQNSMNGITTSGEEITFLAQSEWEQVFDFVSGYMWIEVHCGSECSEITLSLNDSSGNELLSSQAGEFITLEGQVSEGFAILFGSSSSDSTISAPMQSVLPIGSWEREEGDLIPNPGENDHDFTPIVLEYDMEQSDLWSLNPSWHNGSISNLSDQDVLFLNATQGDIFEIWLVASSSDIQVRAFSQNETSSSFTLGELDTNMNTSSGSDVLRTLFAIATGDELWIQIKSDSPFSQYSLRIARHHSLSEDVTIENQVANSDKISGWLQGNEAGECFVLDDFEDGDYVSAYRISLDFNSTSELSFNLQFMIFENWNNVSTLNSWTTSQNRHQVQFFTPGETSAVKVCLQSEQAISWSTHFTILSISDSPGELPSNNSSLHGNWSQLTFNNNSEGDLLPSLYDSSDILWFELEGWPESEFLVRITIDNIGDSPLRFTLMEVNWSDRGTIEATNTTLNGSQSGELTLKVGPGINVLKIEHVELTEDGGNWSWGDESPLDTGKYRVYSTFIQTEEGEEPWFPADPKVGKASEKLILVLGIGLAIPFVWLTLQQRSRNIQAKRLIGKKARLSHLRELLAKGAVKEARADLTANLQIISTLTWNEGVEVWGKPSLHHRTEAVDLAAWLLDRRMAKNGGVPILIGIHIVEETWEVVGLRCEEPDGKGWEIVRVEPRLLHRNDEIFLDQLHSGTRTFLELELIGEGQGVEFSLTGVVDGNPSGMKTTKLLDVVGSEEE